MVKILAALFDLVKFNAPMVNFNASQVKPEFDLYTGKSSEQYKQAFEVLEAEGLAERVEWSGVILFRLNDGKRSTLGI